jgi:nucleoside-diphosphate-sugar epimerase
MARGHGRSVVTGAFGFTGSHLVEVLADAGHEVVATDVSAAMSASGPASRQAQEAVHSRASRIVEADVSVPGALDDAVSGADYVFHTASVLSRAAPWRKLYRVNVAGTSNLVDSIRRTAPRLKRFVAWGAAEVYGHGSGESFDERRLPDPTNDYSRAKWFEEFVVMNRCSEEGIPWTILRPTTVYGPRQAGGMAFLVGVVARLPAVAIPANLSGRFPLVHVRDVCEAALFLSGKAGAAGQIYNVTDDSRMPAVNLARHLARVFGKPFLEVPLVPAGPVRLALWLGADLGGYYRAARGPRPCGIEREVLRAIGADVVVSNQKLKATGYALKHPDPKPGLIDLARWVLECGGLPPL